MDLWRQPQWVPTARFTAIHCVLLCCRHAQPEWGLVVPTSSWLHSYAAYWIGANRTGNMAWFTLDDWTYLGDGSVYEEPYR
jgi:hypothetical protein